MEELLFWTPDESPISNVGVGVFYGGGTSTGQTNKCTILDENGQLVTAETNVGTGRNYVEAAPCGVNALFYGGNSQPGRVTLLNKDGVLVKPEEIVSTNNIASAGGIHNDVSVFYGGNGFQNTLWRLNTNANLISIGNGYAVNKHIAAAASFDTAVAVWGGTSNRLALLAITYNGTVITQHASIGTGDSVAMEYGSAARAKNYGLFYSGRFPDTRSSCTRISNTFTIVATTFTIAGSPRFGSAGATVGDNAVFAFGYLSAIVTETVVINDNGGVIVQNTAVATPRYLLGGAAAS